MQMAPVGEEAGPDVTLAPPDGPDANRGIAKVFGVPVATFRMTRSNPGLKPGP